MSVELSLQVATSNTDVPTESDFRLWLDGVLAEKTQAIVNLRVVDREESRELNARFRGQDRPTNVLSFSADLPPEVDLPLLGDIVICAPLVKQQAEEQGKSARAHWAHLSVHGLLHLLGYDHQDDDEAAEMEALEVKILRNLGFADPYQ